MVSHTKHEASKDHLSTCKCELCKYKERSGPHAFYTRQPCPSDSPCPAGCLFDGGRLTGDCRAPSSPDCMLKKAMAGKAALAVKNALAKHPELAHPLP